MLEAALVLSLGGILVAVLIAVLVYVVGVYLLHAPPQIVGLIAFIVFVLLLLGGVGSTVTV